MCLKCELLIQYDQVNCYPDREPFTSQAYHADLRRRAFDKTYLGWQMRILIKEYTKHIEWHVFHNNLQFICMKNVLDFI